MSNIHLKSKNFLPYLKNRHLIFQSFSLTKVCLGMTLINWFSSLFKNVCHFHVMLFLLSFFKTILSQFSSNMHIFNQSYEFSIVIEAVTKGKEFFFSCSCISSAFKLISLLMLFKILVEVSLVSFICLS